MWDRRPVEGALLARRGAPGSMRMARGPVHFALDRGRHVIVAGNADRVAEVPIEIESFQPRQLVIDLAEREHLLFTGCPPAVAPYLNGDVPAAARALERDGQIQLAQPPARALPPRARPQGGRGDALRGGRRCATRRPSCGRRSASSRRPRRSSSSPATTSARRENYRSAGKLVRAGDAYARADAYDSRRRVLPPRRRRAALDRRAREEGRAVRGGPGGARARRARARRCSACTRCRRPTRTTPRRWRA